MREEYFNWLYSLVCPKGYPGSSYFFLLKALHRKEFYSLVPNDDNRGEDGKALRYQFEYSEIPWFKGPCTMLEMLVALSDRLGQQFVDTQFDRPAHMWFWEMMENLGLKDFTDEQFVRSNGESIVDNILDTLLERTYDFHGNGGIFPLNCTDVDQRNVEIWYQMARYSLEKMNEINV